MARLPFVDFDAISGRTGEALRSLPVDLNIFRIMAHAESNVGHMMKLGGSILSRQKLGHAYRELLILLVAKIEGAQYEWIQHRPIALKLGVSAAQISSLELNELAAPAFNDAERALLLFARQVIQNVRVDPQTFASVRSHFSDREIVEAIIVIGYYMMLSRLTEATETDIDAAAEMAVFDFANSRDPSVKA
jgi:alkylhydroperoxidase family enzyme